MHGIAAFGAKAARQETIRCDVVAGWDRMACPSSTLPDPVPMANHPHPKSRHLTAAGCLIVALAPAATTQSTEAARPDFWRIVERTVERESLEEPAGIVLEHMAGIVNRRFTVEPRIERVERALTRPWTPPALAGELRDLLAGPIEGRKTESFDELWAAIAGYIDLELPDPMEVELLDELDLQLDYLNRPDLEGVELLEALSVFLENAHAAAEEALAEMTDEQRALLFETHGAFREAWYRSHFPKVELPKELGARISEWISLLSGTKYDRGWRWPSRRGWLGWVSSSSGAPCSSGCAA